MQKDHFFEPHSLVVQHQRQPETSGYALYLMGLLT